MAAPGERTWVLPELSRSPAPRKVTQKRGRGALRGIRLSVPVPPPQDHLETHLLMEAHLLGAGCQ